MPFVLPLDIMNRACQHLGVPRITSLNPIDDTKEAAELNFVYDKVRQAELESNLWRFATKRVIRAVLKAADLCAREPEVAARLIVEGGCTERYDYALQTLTENPYAAWRESDQESHWSRRIGLRPCGQGRCRERGSARCQKQKLPAGKFHSIT